MENLFIKSDRILETSNILACIRYIDRMRKGNYPVVLNEERLTAFAKLELEESREIVRTVFYNKQHPNQDFMLRVEAFKKLALGHGYR